MLNQVNSSLLQLTQRPLHAFTVDVEDWYHGAADPTIRDSGERRLHYGLNQLLDILAEYKVSATFFWLGIAAYENPHLVKQVAAQGHEIGCHGWLHEPVYSMDAQRFLNDTQHAIHIISDLTGQPVRSYRAPYFSITRESFWALDILAQLGFHYDSSIFPIKNWRYGIPDFAPQIQQITTPSGSIYELPLSVRPVYGQKIPVSGGAYFRLYPYQLTRSNFRALEQVHQSAIFYIHPWELDLEHPPVPLTWKEKISHSINRTSTKPKLRQLLQEFSFVPLADVLEQHLSIESTFMD
jgi:polysaccharide deacetylase family protein (PEP-CTERM system associated)